MYIPNRLRGGIAQAIPQTMRQQFNVPVATPEQKAAQFQPQMQPSLVGGPTQHSTPPEWWSQQFVPTPQPAPEPKMGAIGQALLGRLSPADLARMGRGADNNARLTKQIRSGGFGSLSPNQRRAVY